MDPLIGSTPRSELRALLSLERIPGIGPRKVRALVEAFGSAERAATVADASFARVAGPAATEARGRSLDLEWAETVLVDAERAGILVVSGDDPRLPASVRELSDPPPVLFLRGDTGLLLRRRVAVVGSRRATARGRDFAHRLGAALGAHGVAVVSGLALGIDGAAHRGALSVGGPTVAVLGSGVDAPSPAAHRRLGEEIARTGLLVSEFVPGTPPVAHHFPRRNRILAALTQAVVVVEAGRRSGASITVGHALDLGLDVFAVPGPTDHPACKGSNALLADGARALVDIERFVRSIGAGSPEMREPAPTPLAAGQGLGADPDRPAPRPAGTLVSGDPVVGRILSAVEGSGTHADQIARRCSLPLHRVLPGLTTLELSGRIVRCGPLTYRRAG